MSRIGKIARLPTAVRDELNERLLEGEPQGQLVAWLNGREDVQAVLKAHYDGRPISDQNLSLWVQGGFEDWKHQQASLNVASRFVEETAGVAGVMAKEAGTEADARGLLASFVTDRVAMMGALAIGELLMATRRMEDGAEKREAILKAIRGLVRLRNTDRQRERAQREAEQAERSAEMHEYWAENAHRRMENGGRVATSGRRPATVEDMSDAQIRATLVRLGRRPAFAEASADKSESRRPGEHRTADGETGDNKQRSEAGPSAVARVQDRIPPRSSPAANTGQPVASLGTAGYGETMLDEETARRLAPNGVPGDWVFLTGRPAAGVPSGDTAASEADGREEEELGEEEM